MAQTQKNTVITCTSLCLGYENHEVLHDLHFSLREGEHLCVLGENGAGKSTLLQALLGLKKPSFGAIRYGRDVAANQIGYLPQTTATQSDFPALAGEIARSAFLNRMGLRPFYTRDERRKALDVMEQLGVAQLAKQSFRELSGGQQRRVMLARALCATTKLLLLDEPTAGLDPIAAREVAHIVADLHNTHGVAVIEVSHNVHTVLRQADLVLHLNKLPHESESFFGTPQAYMSSEIGKRYLRLPGSYEE
ncbi:MAG: ATP-binding cassette domain-containing protein [Oscillospiraceae bacterium]|jgi:zinc transport system ATP-binding protein|nr:ATP-binding cassette domain-containing protein [Oscillospiraceae bacterium]